MDQAESGQEPGIEVLVRGICRRRHQVLICRNRDAGNLYFPGGHVEFGEPARHALEREIGEELGLASKAGRFLGACEHLFRQDGCLHAEINLVFELAIMGLPQLDAPAAKEPWLSFAWLDLGEIGNSAVEPSGLRNNINYWLSMEKGSGCFAALS